MHPLPHHSPPESSRVTNFITFRSLNIIVSICLVAKVLAVALQLLEGLPKLVGVEMGVMLVSLLLNNPKALEFTRRKVETWRRNRAVGRRCARVSPILAGQEIGIYCVEVM